MSCLVFCILRLFANQQNVLTAPQIWCCNISLRGERAFAQELPFCFCRAWPTVNHPLVVFAFLLHTHISHMHSRFWCKRQTSTNFGPEWLCKFYWVNVLFEAVVASSFWNARGGHEHEEYGSHSRNQSSALVIVLPTGDDVCIYDHITNKVKNWCINTIHVEVMIHIGT